jgi:hypothetical protein
LVVVREAGLAVALAVQEMGVIRLLSWVKTTKTLKRDRLELLPAKKLLSDK